MSLTTKHAKAMGMMYFGQRVTGPGRTGIVTRDPRPPVPMGGWNPHTQSIRPTISRGMYRGDPGIFGDIGRFIGGAVGSIPVVGGLVGGGITALSNALDPVKAQQRTVSTSIPTLPPMASLPILSQQAPVTGVRMGGLMPGGEKPYLALDRAGGMVGGPCPSGYHWNKADYFLRDGTFVPKGSKLVKNRRRNPANSRATNRAISRVASAKKHAQTLSRITIRKSSK